MTRDGYKAGNQWLHNYKRIYFIPLKNGAGEGMRTPPKSNMTALAGLALILPFPEDSAVKLFLFQCSRWPRANIRRADCTSDKPLNMNTISSVNNNSL